MPPRGVQLSLERSGGDGATSPITNLSQSPYVSGEVFGMRVGLGTNYGQGREFGFAQWIPLPHADDPDLENEGLAYHPDVVILNFCMTNDVLNNVLRTDTEDRRTKKPYFSWEGGILRLNDEQHGTVGRILRAAPPGNAEVS